MKFIVFDLEATCWDQYDRSDNETIEIGALKIDESKNIVSEFNRFIKPIKYPNLSEFCKKLTSITQEDVNTAKYFYEVKDEFLDWIGDENYFLCSWGLYDKKQFESDCKISSLDDSWIENHISLKHQYANFKKLRRPIGMKKALEIEKIELTGFHHRGIDDARNISKIFLKHFDRWKYEK